MSHYHESHAITFDFDQIKTCLAVCAHPDDAEYYAGGLINQLSKKGVAVHALYATSGDKGNWALHQKALLEGSDKEYLPAEMGAIREKEIPAANQALGIHSFELYRFPDQDLVNNRDELVQNICKSVRTIRPDLILSFDPWKQYELNADHRVISFSCLDALLAAENNNFFREQFSAGLQPHKAPHVLLFHTDHPNLFVNIAEEDISAKTTALLAYASQYPDEKAIHTELVANAKKIAKKEGKENMFAEGFHYIQSL